MCAVRIAVLDRRRLLREMLGRLLEAEPGITVVADARMRGRLRHPNLPSSTWLWWEMSTRPPADG